MSWHSAQKTCLSNNAQLTKITSQNEEAFIHSFLYGNITAPYYWIGLTNKSNVYRWTDGTILGGYTPWNHYQASNTGLCVVIANSTMKWHVQACSTKNYFLCSKGKYLVNIYTLTYACSLASLVLDATCSLPCQNGGTCSMSGCLCSSGWTGDDCSYSKLLISLSTGFLRIIKTKDLKCIRCTRPYDIFIMYL